MCSGVASFGDCVPVEEAYDRALSESDVASKNKENDESVDMQSDDDLGVYQKSYFKRLKKLIEEPVAPLIKQPKTIRGLIMPYGKKTLYTARHVYIMVEESTFILGDYMARPKNESQTSLINPINTK